MMMSLILYTLVSLSCLIHLVIKSLLEDKTLYTSKKLTSTKKEEDDDISLHVNTTKEDIHHQDTKIQGRDYYLLLNAMEFIQSWISVTIKEEMLSNSFNDAKSIILNHSEILLNKENDSYGLAYSLSVLIISALNMPTVPLQCILFLTHAFRVSTVELPPFILNVLSPSNTIVQNFKQNQPAELNYNDYYLNTATDNNSNEKISVSMLEKLNRLQAELWLTLPNHTPISPLLSKRNSITSLDSSSSYTTNNSTVTTSFTSDNESLEYKLFNFIKDDQIISERLNPFNSTYDDLIHFKSNFYQVKSKIDITLKYDQGFKFIHKNRYIQVKEAVESIIQNCNYLESRFIEFQSGYVFSQLYEFISTFMNETIQFMEKAVIDHEDLIELESWVYNNVHLVDSLSKAYSSSSYNNKIMELSVKSQDLLNQFKTISKTWYKVNEIKSFIQDGKSILSTLDLSDNFLYQHHENVLETVQFIHTRIYSTIHEEFQLLANESMINVLQQTTYKTLSSHEKMVSVMIYSILKEIQTFKNDLISSTLIIQKYLDKQTLKRDIHHASNWLNTFKCNLVTCSLLDISEKEDLLNFQVQYDEFLLTEYNEICEYFTRYSNEILDQQYINKNIKFNSYQVNDLNYQQLGDSCLFEEYQWFVKLQTLCDETSRSLKVFSVYFA